MTDNILAPNARWQGRNQTGQPVQNGKLYTYLNMTTNPKATYQDYQGLQPNTNPVILDGKGEANIYWATDDLYTIKLFTEDDEEVYTQDNYPVVGTNTIRIVQESQVNVARNEQFYFWNYGSSFSPVAGNGSQSDYDFICNDWLYKREATGYTVNITRQAFTLDQTEVPNNPSAFFRYECTSTPAGETNNRLYQRYNPVLTFAGNTVTVSMYLKSPTASEINVYLVQNFGSGGSPSAEVATLAFQETLTTDWQRYSGTITLPNLTGKTLGTDANSDALILRINFPNDVVATIDICDVQLQQGDQLTVFPYEVIDSQFKELDDRINYGVPLCGDVKATLRATADTGWLLMNDTTIGNAGSGATTVGFSLKALYSLIWSAVSNVYAPIYDSAGAITTRGASAEADYNALKRLSLTKTLGRVIASAGTAVLQSTFTADAGTDQLTLTSAGITQSFYTAVPVTVSVSGGALPTPLAPATTYYVIPVGATSIQLATTVANAVAGTAINLTDAGSGTLTIQINYAAYTMGQVLGEPNHSLTQNQLPSPLTGTINTQAGIQAGGGGPIFPLGAGAASNISALTFNGSPNTPMNNLQPTVFLTYQIKL